MTKLEQEAGSSDWWESAEISQWVNDIYRETAKEYRLCKKRDETSVTVAEQASYTIPVPTGYELILSVTNVDYDNIPLIPKSTMEFDAAWYQWREATSGTPEYWYFDLGNENTIVSLQRKPSVASKQVGFDMVLLPSEIISTAAPKFPFTDGLLLVDGVMSIALGKNCGGRDLDRANWYWNKFVGGLGGILKDVYPNKVHRLKSIDEVGYGTSLSSLSLLQLPVTE